MIHFNPRSKFVNPRDRKGLYLCDRLRIHLTRLIIHSYHTLPVVSWSTYVCSWVDLVAVCQCQRFYFCFSRTSIFYSILPRISYSVLGNPNN